MRPPEPQPHRRRKPPDSRSPRTTARSTAPGTEPTPAPPLTGSPPTAIRPVTCGGKSAVAPQVPSDQANKPGPLRPIRDTRQRPRGSQRSGQHRNLDPEPHPRHQSPRPTAAPAHLPAGADLRASDTHRTTSHDTGPQHHPLHPTRPRRHDHPEQQPATGQRHNHGVKPQQQPHEPKPTKQHKPPEPAERSHRNPKTRPAHTASNGHESAQRGHPRLGHPHPDTAGTTSVVITAKDRRSVTKPLRTWPGRCH